MHTISEIQLRYTASLPIPNTVVRGSQDAYDILISSWDMDTIALQEELKILLLNRANKVIGISTLSKGGTAGTVVDPKLIFVVALKTNAHSIILAHNHPSQNVQPSPRDEEITQKAIDAGKLLDIQVLDHLIIGAEQYYSFADEGRI
jgi:DNA repair protein RadC